jgi:uroporphyrinogen-III synthase
LRTVDLSHDEALRTATLDLVEHPPDFLVATTGMGMTMWLEAADGWDLGAPLRRALQQGRSVARGAKALSALRRQGFEVAWQAPSETMEEVVEFLTNQGIGSARVALQLFDPGGHPSTAALAGQCRELVEVPVYRWLMPDDEAPATRLIEEICAGGVDAVTFTSQPAVHHLFRIAERLGRAEELRAACNGMVIPICVGPVCGEAALEEGITGPRWPDPPRLAAMIRLVASELGSRAGEA